MELRPGDGDKLRDALAFDVDNNDDSKPGGASEGSGFVKIPDPLRYAWLAAAVALLLAHAYETPGSSFPLGPTADATTLAFLIFAVVALCINYVSEVGFPGGGRLAFRKYEKAKEAATETKASADALRVALHEYSDQMQSWTNSILLLSEQLEKYGATEKDRDKIIARFCVERLEEARDLIQEDDDRVRLSVWWNFPELGGLVLLYSNGAVDEATQGHVFAPGEGLAGQCFVEGRTYNLRDAQDSAYYQKISDNPKYHGLLLVPLRIGTGKVRGVLSVDREAKERFSDDADNAASALGDLIVYALTHPTLGGVFLDDDEA